MLVKNLHIFPDRGNEAAVIFRVKLKNHHQPHTFKDTT